MSRLGKVSQFVSIGLAIVILTLAAKMSVEERACCQKMAGRCETSAMPSSHSCCQHPVSRQAVTASKIQTNNFVPAVAVLSEAASPLPQVMARGGSTSFESPPESPPQIINVLRF